MSDHEPGTVRPTLPEHYRAEKISGMLPDQIIFPTGSCYDVDEATGGIYLELDHKITEYEAAPTYFGADRTALMKVLLVEEGSEIEGFIADLRHLTPGSIFEKQLTFTDDMTDSDRSYTETLNRTHVPLLGAIFRDLDGKEIYQGDPRLLTHAAHLAVELDNLQETTDSSLKADIEEKIASIAMQTSPSAPDHTPSVASE